MSTKKKSVAKLNAKIEVESDARVRPCIIPDQHTDVCDCYGVAIRRNPEYKVKE